MDISLTPNFAFRKHYRKVLKKYFVYILLFVLLVVNIIIFPDLLNHKDIKLNDMSYLLPTETNYVTGSGVGENKVHNVYNTGIGQSEEDVKVVNDDSQEGVKNENTQTVPETNVSEEVKEVKEAEEKNQEQKEIPQNVNTAEIPPLNSHSYLLLLFLILTALFISLGIYINNNLDSIKLLFNAGKNPNIREYIASGYELLQDI